MTNVNKWECYTYSAAAEVLGVAVWKLRYAVDSGYLPRPGVVFKRRALFSPGQIEWMRAYFARECNQNLNCGRVASQELGDTLPAVGIRTGFLGSEPPPSSVTPA
jgi:hypothetical protein